MQKEKEVVKPVRLYKRRRQGNITIWTIRVIERGDNIFLRKTYGILEGKIQIRDRRIKGKNKGKVNETTDAEQAEFQMRSDIEGKLKENMVIELKFVDHPPKYLLPMKAQPAKLGKIKYPVYVQPKMNGIRGLCLDYLDQYKIRAHAHLLGKETYQLKFNRKKNKVNLLDDKTGILIHSVNRHSLISNEGNEFENLNHIKKSIGNITEASIDGEIYHHDLTFTEIVRRTKKYRKKKTKELQYWIYDLPDINLYFETRYEMLSKLIPKNHPVLKLVPTFRVNSDREVKYWHDKFVNQGFEGIILRNLDGLYEYGERVKQLLKYKEFIDEEFTICGAKSEELIDSKTGEIFKLVIWTCENNNGTDTEVDCRPRGSVKQRRKLYTNRKKYYGKKLTIRYQERSEDTVPIFPVGLSIRDYE